MKKVEPKLIDVTQIDKELEKLFSSIPYGKADAAIIKYKSRFNKQKLERNNPEYVPTKNNALSLGKKLEILCSYGDHRIVKVDRKLLLDNLSLILKT